MHVYQIKNFTYLYRLQDTLLRMYAVADQKRNLKPYISGFSSFDNSKANIFNQEGLLFQRHTLVIRLQGFANATCSLFANNEPVTRRGKRHLLESPLAVLTLIASPSPFTDASSTDTSSKDAVFITGFRIRSFSAHQQVKHYKREQVGPELLSPTQETPRGEAWRHSSSAKIHPPVLL